MSPPPHAQRPDKLRIGAWCVDPIAGQISRGAETVRLDARTLRLLLDLVEHAGQVVSIDDLLDRVWAGVIVTPDSVYQAVTALRRLLGDDPKRPQYIATVPRLGYRLVATVEPWTEDKGQAAPAPGARSRWRLAGAAAVAMVLLLASLAGFLQYERGRGVAQAPVTVGVLPFLDLTDGMDDLPLADDVTEGLIDRLSAYPRLRTPGFRASLQLRGKHVPLAQAARTLGVAYVVEGSLRRTGEQTRITARLMRADDGFVIWVQTYEQPRSQIPAAQAGMARGIAGALASARSAR